MVALLPVGELATVDLVIPLVLQAVLQPHQPPLLRVLPRPQVRPLLLEHLVRLLVVEAELPCQLSTARLQRLC